MGSKQNFNSSQESPWGFPTTNKIWAPQRLILVRKWIVVFYGSCPSCIPFDQRRQVLCRACKDLTLLMKVALLLSSCEKDTQCCLGTAGKHQGEHHIPRQKLLIVCFLKEKVYTDICVCTLACSCLALKPSEELTGSRLEAFACIKVAKSGSGSKTNQKPPTSCRTTKDPTTNHYCSCIREKGRVAYNPSPFKTSLTAAKSHQAYQHLFVVSWLSCPPCVQQLCTDHSGRTPSEKLAQLSRSSHRFSSAAFVVILFSILCKCYYLLPLWLTWQSPALPGKVQENCHMVQSPANSGRREAPALLQTT